MEASEKYQMLFNSMDEGYCIIQLLYDEGGIPYDWRFLEVNPAFEKHNGLSNATGKTILELTPNIERKWIERYAIAADSDEGIRFQDDSDALGRVFDLYAFRIGSPEERKVAVLFTDITKRTYAEQMLLQSEKQKNYLLKLNDVLRHLQHPKTIRKEVAQLAMDYFGADRCYYCEVDKQQGIITDEASRKDLQPVAGIYSLSDFSIFKKSLDEGYPFVVYDVNETDILDDQLRSLCIDLKVISFIDVPVIKNGLPVGIFSVVQTEPRLWTDVEINLAVETADRIWAALERAKAEEALRESEERNRAMVSQTSVGIFGADLSGAITFLNEKALQLFGLEKDEGIGKNILEITVAEFRDATLNKFQNLITHGNSFESEKKIMRKDGSEFWANVSVAGIKNCQSAVQSIVGVVIDITERKVITESLQKNERQLKNLLKQRDEFIGIASHELKTPITSMKGYAEIVQERLDDLGDKEDSRLLSRLNIQIDRLTALINNLLDTTKISEGQLVLSLEEIHLNELLNERTDELKHTTDHDFKLELERLPSIMADKERVGQVITNLLSNAIKYSPKGTQIMIKSHAREEGVVVSVEDKGYGIPQADLDRIFDKFFRVKAYNMDTFPGMGLGLYITAQIIQNHNGAIHVQSEEGEGSIFSFVLPYKQP